MKTVNSFLVIILIAALFSCNGHQKDQNENAEIYSEETISKSENLEREAEELDKEVDEFVKDM